MPFESNYDYISLAQLIIGIVALIYCVYLSYETRQDYLTLLRYEINGTRRAMAHMNNLISLSRLVIAVSLVIQSVLIIFLPDYPIFLFIRRSSLLVSIFAILYAGYVDKKRRVIARKELANV